MRIKFFSCSSLLFLAIPCFSLLSGCMLATQQDMIKLDADVRKLHENQADLLTKMSELSGNLQSLNSQLESSQERMTTLSQKLDDLQADIDRRMNVLSGQVTGTSSPAGSSNPSDVYRLAIRRENSIWPSSDSGISCRNSPRATRLRRLSFKSGNAITHARITRMRRANTSASSICILGANMRRRLCSSEGFPSSRWAMAMKPSNHSAV
jgi:hypothetical protein